MRKTITSFGWRKARVSNCTRVRKLNTKKDREMSLEKKGRRKCIKFAQMI